MTTQQIFEFAAKLVWPYARNFVKLSKRCRRCILSEKYTELHDGVCPYCSAKGDVVDLSIPEVSPEMQSRFDQRIRSQINENKYHALLLLSGGKDSAYMLHRLKKEYPQLKVLCVVVNNGFMSSTAIEGSKFAAEKMNSDLLTVNAHVDEFAAKFRQAFLDLNGRGAYGVIDFVDGDFIFEIGQRIARQMNIPVVFGGVSWVQAKIILGETDFEQDKGLGLHVVFPLVIWRTGEKEIRDYVRANGLLPPGTESPITSNSSLITAMSVIDILNNGYSSFEPEFAQLIREKKADRKTWLYVFELLEFASLKGLLNGELNASLAKLDLKISDIIKNSK